jgi:translocator protein
MKPFIGLVGWIAASLAAGAIGGVATSLGRQDGWFERLAKPPWNPPDWVFSPVWITLYILMGVAAWLIWRAPAPGKTPAYAAFAAQLALNALWSWIFFYWRDLGLAFAEILVLGLMILVTMALFARHSKLAAALLAPYLAWVTFAGILNYSIWQLNA